MFPTPGRGSWYVGHLAGIPLFIHWSVVVLLLMVYDRTAGYERDYATPLEWFILRLIVLVMGIVLHELGHGLTARLLGNVRISITLWGLGGVCHSQGDPLPRREIPILIAGPLVSLGLAAVGYFGAIGIGSHVPQWLAGSPDLARILILLLDLMIKINLALAIFNLMPIYPLDGGQLVYNIILGLTGRQLTARKIALATAVLGAMAFFAWQTGMFEGQLPGSDSIYLAMMLSFLVFQSFAFLH